MKNIVHDYRTIIFSHIIQIRALFLQILHVDLSEYLTNLITTDTDTVRECACVYEENTQPVSAAGTAS